VAAVADGGGVVSGSSGSGLRGANLGGGSAGGGGLLGRDGVVGWVAARPVWLALVGLVVVCGLPWLGVDAVWLRLVQLVAIFTLIVSGTNLSFGFAGELSFAQPAIYAVGAYVGGYAAIHGANDLLVALVLGGVAGGVAGLLIGVPGLRLSSWSLAMVSFFVVLLVPDIVAILQRWTGGLDDLTGIPQAKLLGVTLSANGLFVATVVVAAIWLVFLRNVVLSRHGSTIGVLRESPVLAQSLGSSVYALKLKVYVLGSVAAGLAGVLFAYYDQILTPDIFGFSVAIGIIAASIIGGSRSIYGAILGAAIIQIGPFEFNSFANYSLVIYGVLLLVGGLLVRQGIAPLARSGLARLLARWGIVLGGGSIWPRSVLAGAGGKAVADGQVGGSFAAGGGADGSGLVRVADPVALVVEDLRQVFGGVQALSGVSLVAEPGKVTAIIGPNGSGKTTLLNAVSGFHRPTSGVVRLGAVRLDRRGAARAARAGVSRTFQTPVIPDSMTTLEVVTTARFRSPYVSMVASVLRLGGYRRALISDREAARQALDLVDLADVADAVASELALGTRRKVEVARAIAARPRVVLLDEPASGLSEAEVRQLGQVIRAVAASGVVVVLVEHNFEFVMQHADVVHVLSLGATLVSGPPGEVRDDPRVVESYLGTPGALGGDDRGGDAVGGGEPASVGGGGPAVGLSDSEEVR